MNAIIGVAATHVPPRVIVPTREELEVACTVSQRDGVRVAICAGYAVEAEYVRAYDPPTGRSDPSAVPMQQWIFVLHIPGDLTLGGYDTVEAFARFAHQYLLEVRARTRAEVATPWG